MSERSRPVIVTVSESSESRNSTCKVVTTVAIMEAVISYRSTYMRTIMRVC